MNLQSTTTAERPILRILLVEDLPRVQRYISEIIESDSRFKIVSICESEDQAVEQCLRLKPDVAIVDIKLSEGTGLGFIRTVFAVAPEAKPIVIVLSNYAFDVVKKQADQYGVRYFLDKSKDSDKLIPILREVFESVAHRGRRDDP